MITKNNIERLNNIVKKYALQDFYRANPPRKRWNPNRKHVPYTLSPMTNEAREMLAIAMKKDISREEEEKVKAYLLRQKISGMEG